MIPFLVDATAPEATTAAPAAKTRLESHTEKRKTAVVRGVVDHGVVFPLRVAIAINRWTARNQRRQRASRCNTEKKEWAMH
jgi:hypothetical protein